METSKFEYFKNKLLSAWQNLSQKSEEDAIADMGRERIVVFIVSFILALCLWLMVNLSRDYNLNISLPISLGGVPEDRALTENLPQNATVSVSGEGWKLINIYNNPPTINVDVNDAEVNLYDQVQQQMNDILDISVQKVQPLILTVDLEERVTKKVPVQSRITVSFDEQFGFAGNPRLKPDSVTINGARSLIKDIQYWPTDSMKIEGISGDFSRSVALKDAGELINLSQDNITFSASVAQYTEGESKVDLMTRGLPSGRSVSYSPPSITVKYDIPINEYTQLSDKSPFEAFVTYRQITQDSTGFVTPQIEQTVGEEFNIKVRSFQPGRVAYFMILD